MAKSISQTIKNNLLYVLIRVLILVVQLVSRPVAFMMAKFLGNLAFLLLRTERHRMQHHLTIAFGKEKSAPEIELWARQTFVDLAQNAIDAIRLRYMNADNIRAYITVSGEEHLANAYHQGRGVIALSAHLGCFELIPVFFAYRGFQVSVFSRVLYDRRLDHLLVRNRQKHGVHDIHRRHGIRGLLRALRNGHCLGILGDQDTKVEGIFVPFFGKLAHTPSGPAAMALTMKAPIVIVVIHRDSRTQRHHIQVTPPLIPPESTSKEDAIRELTTQYNQQLEMFIQEHPTQWVWMHRRWKKQPPKEITN
ncbi:MAG: hypothetical protein D6675_15970 [Gemmatimonadetes bacterium]|nr:MAG: hypothetical protein D6675_15970 [Gemmatimonadota bacterium]